LTGVSIRGEACGMRAGSGTPRTGGARRHVRCGGIRKGAARGVCTRCPGMCGSGVRTGMIRGRTNGTRKGSCSRREAVQSVFCVGARGIATARDRFRRAHRDPTTGQTTATGTTAFAAQGLYDYLYFVPFPVYPLRERGCQPCNATLIPDNQTA